MLASLNERIRFIHWIDMESVGRASTQHEHREILQALRARDAQASELLLDDLVEQFRALVRADPTLGGACQPGPLAGSDDSTDGVQVMRAEPVDFAGVRCHSVVLQLRTWSYL